MTNKRHVLEKPLIVYSGGPDSQVGIVPKGTSLHYERSFPEGFDRFVLFVNVERSPLPLEEVDPPGLVDPLSAAPSEMNADEHVIPIEELRRMLQEVGVKKSDLQQILATYD